VADVTVTPASSAGQVQVSGAVVFTPADWALPLSISVTAIDDNLFEPPPQTDDIVHAVASADPAYGGAFLAAMPVTIIDNDGSANLELAVLSAPPVVAAGTAFTIDFRVANGGPDVSVGSTLTLPASAGYQFTGAAGVLSCASDAVTGVSCQLPGAAAGASFTLSLSFTAGAVGSYPTTYSVTSIQPDPVPGNNTRLQTITVN
jgi:hypothetical protein